MEFLKKIRDRHQASVDATIESQAEEIIRIEDFDGGLYIGYNGDTLVNIQEDWTADDILKKLKAMRENFIKHRKCIKAPVRTLI